MVNLRLQRFFKIENYRSKYKIFKKKLKIKELSKKDYSQVELNYTWNITSYIDFIDQNISEEKLRSTSYHIFGIPVDLKNLNWHKDKFSDFEYPLVRFDKVNASQYFNKGIELVFPWEQSRFYFAPLLAQKFLSSKDISHYLLFKELVLDWIKKNPFQTGVNWLSTMDVALRAVNWIVGVNLFRSEFEKDKYFQEKISRSLLMHAHYVSAFPAIYENGRITNHTTSAYFGLLVLSLTLNKFPQSAEWKHQAVQGLERCIDYQVYYDGVDFEGSIPYHRLVLELFAYAGICAKANGIEFSKNYYQKLFKMFEFTAAYVDKSGSAPQIGDNDSGRAIIFHEDLTDDPYQNEHDHSYLLSLGNHIFNYDFNLKDIKISDCFLKYVPEIRKINLDEINITPRKTDLSIKFENGGAYILKNEDFDLLVSCFPIGQNGFGGHNNIDSGSFTLSISGKQFIVDPGTPFYSSNREIRDRFRRYDYHNTIYNERDLEINMQGNGYWSLNEYFTCKLNKFEKDEVEIAIKSNETEEVRFRKFKLLKDTLQIEDTMEGIFYSRINLAPDVEILSQSDFEIRTNFGKINFNGARSIKIINYEYSFHYGKIASSIFIEVYSENYLETSVTLI